jgi:hypothetical protein
MCEEVSLGLVNDREELRVVFRRPCQDAWGRAAVPLLRHSS